MITKEREDLPSVSQERVDTTSYRSIFKATSLFGGVQVYQILIQILRSKIIAVLLGPMGVGVLGLFQSAHELVKQITSFGLAQSAVREVSSSYAKGSEVDIAYTISILRKLVWFTGLLGTFILLFASPIFSYTSFGSYEYIV